MISLLQCLSTDFARSIAMYKIHCIANAKNTVESALKRRGCQQSGREIWIPKNIYHDDSKKKRQAVKKRCNDKKKFVKQYKKEKDVESIKKYVFVCKDTSHEKEWSLQGIPLKCFFIM